MTNKLEKKLKNKINKVSGKMMRVFVGGVFLVFVGSLIAALGIGAIISNNWTLDDYGSVIMYTLIILAISLVVGMSLAVGFSQILIKTTKPYMQALQRIGGCDFSVRVEDNRFTADIELAKNFNEAVSRLEKIETLRENFISDFSHEFKTPIVSISGFASLLKNPNLSAAERNEYLDVIIDESNRLVKLSESVLLLSRLDGQAVVKNKYRLDEQLRQCVLLFDNECKQRRIELDLDLQCDYIIGSVDLNSQIWINLLSNAVKFTPDGGRITISAKDDGNKVTVSVADTGLGMDDEVLQNIFNKFYQGDKSHTTPGNGLGLPIVKKIVELQNGKIDVESCVGKGSVFTITLDS